MCIYFLSGNNAIFKKLLQLNVVFELRKKNKGGG